MCRMKYIADTVAKLGVQAVEQLGVLLQVPDLVLAKCRPDSPLDVPLVHALGGDVHVRDLVHVIE